ncbi:MAG TPA: MFS transporter [Prolixibacteraceae bacterium]|nr:MFS transporter [Marinilabiliales bacterium]HBL76687.1 MFS transporter [Prolixibacteraceae bacterium]HCU62932.1 MFS transporter [Prolixibacteraceae bacterium]
MLIATMFCYLFYYTGRQTFGFAIPFIEEELGFSKTTLGYMGTALLWSYAIGQAVNGNLADKFGGRVMMSFGAVLSCCFNWVVSFGNSFLGIFIPWVGNGFVQSMGMAPGSKILSNWFGNKERGIAFGLFLFAAGMSSILAYVTPLVVLKVFGLDWRWIFRLPVLLLLVGGVVFYLVVRDRPEDLGFTPPNEPAEDDKLLGTSEEVSSETSSQRYKSVLKNWRFMAASIAIGFQSSARYGLLIWVPVHFLGKDWQNSDSAWISVALPVGMAFGAVTGGWISDKIFNSVRWKLITTFMGLGAIVSMIMFFLPKDHWLGISVLFLCGFFVYGSQSAFWALCPDLLGRQRVGTGVGIMDFFAYLFAGLVCPLIGKMIESHQILDSSTGLMVSHTAVIFPVVAASCTVSALLVMFIKR